MKKKNLIILLLAVCLLVSCTTAFIFGEEQHVTREEMFEAIVKALALDDAEVANKTFPDADQVAAVYRKSINAGINAGLILGRDNGTLDPKTEMSLSDLKYILSRIDFKPKTVVETKYVGGGTTTVPGSDVAHCVGDNHVYQLDLTTGYYTCLCDEHKIAVGTRHYPVIEDKQEVYVFDESEFEALIAEYESGDVYYAIDESKLAIIDQDETIYTVACNADIYDLDDYENRIGIIDFFEKYGSEDYEDEAFCLAIELDGQVVTALAVVAVPEVE